jgi:HD-like signal output (HDOD) protein
MNKLDANKLLTESSRLPTMPEVARQLLSISEWEDVDLKDVAEIISKDISLSSKILRVVNSPFYGFPHEIGTISQALVILGLRATRSLTLSFSLLRDFSSDRAEAFDYSGFWTRSLNTAIAARELARVCGMQAVEEAFLAGLLQDIGVMLIARCAPERYKPILSEAEDKLAPPLELERKHLGTDHVEVAKLLLEKWGLPASLCIPIMYHHAPANTASSNDQMVLAVRIQHFAVLVGRWLYASSDEDTLLEDLKRLASEHFGLNPKQLEAIMYKVDSVAEQMLEFFDLAAPRPNTYAYLVEKANFSLGNIVSEQERLLRELEAARAESQKLSEQLRLANNKLLDEARNDTLTNLPNRRQF